MLPSCTPASLSLLSKWYHCPPSDSSQKPGYHLTSSTSSPPHIRPGADASQIHPFCPSSLPVSSHPDVPTGTFHVCYPSIHFPTSSQPETSFKNVNYIMSFVCWKPSKTFPQHWQWALTLHPDLQDSDGFSLSPLHLWPLGPQHGSDHPSTITSSKCSTRDLPPSGLHPCVHFWKTPTGLLGWLLPTLQVSAEMQHPWSSLLTTLFTQGHTLHLLMSPWHPAHLAIWCLLVCYMSFPLDHKLPDSMDHAYFLFSQPSAPHWSLKIWMLGCPWPAPAPSSGLGVWC